MTVLATRLDGVRASETKAMTARAAELRASGQSIITLSQGEPDFDTPAHVREAACRAIADGRTRYTAVAGIPELREAITVKLERDNALRYSPDQVTVGCGAKQVLFNALLATLSPGDEVVVPVPCWVSYSEMVRLAGGAPVLVPTADTRFRITPEALERAITPRTKWLMLNSPSNPTGAVYSAAELQALGDVLERHPHVWVLTDDIYEKLIYGDVPFATMAAACPALAGRTLTVNGLSKSHAMTGWRVGYGAGPLPLIKAMNLIQSQSTSHTSSISQHAAVAALLGDDSFLDGFREQYRRRRDLVVAAVNEVPGLRAAVPDGAFYVYVECGGVLGERGDVRTDTDLAMHLLNAGVAVVPGAGFLTSPYFRISYASATDKVIEGCARIARACAALGENR